uniref:MIF4G domain-containing protein n=1 Tax=Lactuca sativa TaxID=4236 RepID=A0A9R1WJT0_LACSA|nr:hypothetical protein LSAT_V11C200080880 [Lactuca sativa]
MMSEFQDKSSMEYQRMTWDALRKSINGLMNKVNATNIKYIIPELFAENLIRGRGLFFRSCMKSHSASPVFTDVFAALVAVINTKFLEVGDLLLKRILLQLQRAYKRNDKVVHELIALELLTILLENPTDDSVEVVIGFVTECGSILRDLSPKAFHGDIDKRVQFLIEGLFALRTCHPSIRPELDLIEVEDQLTHKVSLLDEIDPEIALDLKRSILRDESSSEDEEYSDDVSSEEKNEEQMRRKEFERVFEEVNT